MTSPRRTTHNKVNNKFDDKAACFSFSHEQHQAPAPCPTPPPTGEQVKMYKYITSAGRQRATNCGRANRLNSLDSVKCQVLEMSALAQALQNSCDGGTCFCVGGLFCQAKLFWS